MSGTRLRVGVVPALAAVAFAAVLAGQAPRVVPRPIVIIGGTVVDGTGAPARRNDAIVVQDGRIKAMGLTAAKRAPRDARMIDATGRWVVPGLVDAAVHLTLTGGPDARPDLVPDPRGRSYAAIFADIRRAPAPYLRAYLCAGVTSILNVGGSPWTLELREGRANDALSPRIATTGPWIAPAAPTALQLPGDEAFLVPGEKAGAATLADRLVKDGADLLAVLGEAGGQTADAAMLRAVVAEAHARKRRVVVDAGRLSSLAAAVEAGADAIIDRVSEEIPAELLARMATQQTIVVAAIVVNESARQLASGNVAVQDYEGACAPAETIEMLEAAKRTATGGSGVLAAERNNLARLAAAQVPLVAGSGAGELRVPHGPSLHTAFTRMSEAGMAPMAILLSATRDAARLLGRETEIGQLKEGFAGDIVLLSADPLADIRNARKVSVVIKGGAIYER